MRARAGRMIAGVCAGFARTYQLDVTVTRIAVCLLALFSAGTVFVAYLIAWIVMPQAPYTFSTPAADIVTP